MSDTKRISVPVGHIPSGLFIICGQDSEGKIDGFLGSWVQQISFSPLLISLCVKPGRPAYDSIKAGQKFTINIVGEHDKSYLKHFWSGYDPKKNPFAEVPHQVKDGAVVLDGAKSTLVCRLRDVYSPGDHEVVVAEILESFVQDENARPMVHIRKSGLDY